LIGAKNEITQSTVGQQVHSYALPTIAAGVLFTILYLGRVLFITSITAVILALILEPFVGFLVRLRFPRFLAAFLVGGIATLFLYFAGLAAYNQLSGLADEAPAFKERLSVFVTSVTGEIQKMEDSTTRFLAPARKPEPPAAAPAPSSRTAPRRSRREPAPQLSPPPSIIPGVIPEVRIHEDRNPVADYVYARLGTLYEFLLMASFVPFLVYFMLSWRDHIYRSFLRFFEGADRLAAARSLGGVAEMARAFVVGNFLIGVLLAVVSWAAFALIHIPYPFLIGALSGFMSLIPYIGVPVALIPPIIAALAGGAPSSVTLLASFIVLILHLAAMNVLYPKLVGARVHLNPLVVTFSLMFWGFLWDAPGLLLAIPITAGIKAVCDNVAGLRSYGRFLGD
jgi:predicted PurR-regulated permease PerM